MYMLEVVSFRFQKHLQDAPYRVVYFFFNPQT